jgi:dihydroflavonol-4-reductase
MQALVTGASGFIGANLCRELLSSGWRVRALVRKIGRSESLEGLPCEMVEGDILEPQPLSELARGCDAVFHVASPFRYWGYSREEMERVAVKGALNVVDAARTARAARLLLTSSTVVLGSSPRGEIRAENGVLSDPDAPVYVRVKHEQERAVFARAAEAGVDAIAVLPSITVGPYDAHLSSSNAIIVNYMKDPWKTTWTGGCNIVSVRDVARGHVLAATRGRPGQRYILGSQNWRWSQIHTAISELCGIPGPLTHATHTSAYLASAVYELVARVTGNPPPSTRAQAKMIGRFYWYSHDRAAAELGWEPRGARLALSDAIGWLTASRHISSELRRRILLSDEVYAARAQMGMERAS